MRGWLVCAALSMAVFAAGDADAQSVNVAGTWDIQGSIQSGGVLFSATPTCTFEQVGARLAGTCIGPNAAGPVTGVVSGNAVSWTWTHHATDVVGNNGITNFNGAYIDAHPWDDDFERRARAGYFHPDAMNRRLAAPPLNLR